MTDNANANLQDIDLVRNDYVEYQDVKTSWWLYPVGMLLTAVGWFLLSLPFLGMTFDFAGANWNGGYLVWCLGLIHFITGIRFVTGQEIGGIFFLEYMTWGDITAKPVCVPVGLFRLGKLPILVEETEIPTEPEKIFRGDGNVPEGMRPPTRITFKEGTDKNDPLERRITEEVPFFIRLRVESYFTFYSRIKDVPEAMSQIEDMGVGLLGVELPQVTFAHAVLHLNEYSQKLEDELRTSVEGWGAKIVQVRIKPFIISHSLNTEIQKISERTAAKRSTIIDSEAEQERLMNVGMGEGMAEELRLNGKTDGLHNMAEKLMKSEAGRQVLAADVAMRIGMSPNKLIIGASGGNADLLAAAGAFADLFKSGETPKQPEPKQAT